MALNENLENLVNKASDAACAVGHAARNLAVISKKRAQIAAEQEKIRRNYARIGKVYYKDYITDEEPDEAEYLPLCDAVSDSFRRINRLREEIAAIKAEAEVADPAVEIVPYVPDPLEEDFVEEPAPEE